MTIKSQVPELMLIDATDKDLRIALLDKRNKLTDLFLDSDDSRSIRNNIYLGTITRVEHSLQAAFVDYGGDKNGFLPFSEIHPDYYQIPVQDKKGIYEKMRQSKARDLEDAANEEGFSSNEDQEFHPSSQVYKSYNIQEVIKRGQNVLVQVYRDGRGNKGVSLTTYISLAGRYCVFMPNSPSANEVGISKKIEDPSSRKRISGIAESFKIGPGMRIVIRTASESASEESLRKDYEYLATLWNRIREKTLQSRVPAPIHFDASLIRQVFRDSYVPTIKKVIVHGDKIAEVQDACDDFLHNAKVKIVEHKERMPLFTKYGAETQVSELMQDHVDLPSGGYLVINQTEALVAIDVNSGRSTSEGSIEETAFQTNAEAAVEIARQLRLRELGGLIVVDFIDMMLLKNKKEVESILKEAFDADKAKIQFTKISMFGLLECSRQRIRPSIYEAMAVSCPDCSGTGTIRTEAFVTNSIARFLKAFADQVRGGQVKIYVSDRMSDLVIEAIEKDVRDIALAAKFGIRVVKDPNLSRDAFSIKDVRGDEEVVIAQIEGSMGVLKNAKEKLFDKKNRDSQRKKRFPKRYSRSGKDRGGIMGFISRMFSSGY